MRVEVVERAVDGAALRAQRAELEEPAVGHRRAADAHEAPVAVRLVHQRQRARRRPHGCACSRADRSRLERCTREETRSELRAYGYNVQRMYCTAQHIITVPLLYCIIHTRTVLYL